MGRRRRGRRKAAHGGEQRRDGRFPRVPPLFLAVPGGSGLPAWPLQSAFTLVEVICADPGRSLPCVWSLVTWRCGDGDVCQCVVTVCGAVSCSVRCPAIGACPCSARRKHLIEAFRERVTNAQSATPDVPLTPARGRPRAHRISAPESAPAHAPTVREAPDTPARGDAPTSPVPHRATAVTGPAGDPRPGPYGLPDRPARPRPRTVASVSRRSSV